MAENLTGGSSAARLLFATPFRHRACPCCYGLRTAETSLRLRRGAAGAESVRALVTGLRPGVTYHYRLVATNASGQSAGADRTFTTAAAPRRGPPAPTGLCLQRTVTIAAASGAGLVRGTPGSDVIAGRSARIESPPAEDATSSAQRRAPTASAPARVRTACTPDRAPTG
jgi:hypothetical protein